MVIPSFVVWFCMFTRPGNPSKNGAQKPSMPQGWDNWWDASRLEVWSSNDSVWSTTLALWWPWRRRARAQGLVKKEIDFWFRNIFLHYIYIYNVYIYMCIYIYMYIYISILGRIFLEWISMDFLILNENQLFGDNIFGVPVFQALEHTHTHTKSADKPPHFQLSCKKLVIRDH